MSVGTGGDEMTTVRGKAAARAIGSDLLGTREAAGGTSSAPNGSPTVLVLVNFRSGLHRAAPGPPTSSALEPGS